MVSYFKAGSGTNCVDENECENGQNGGCDDVCVNTPGIMLIKTEMIVWEQHNTPR